MGFDTSELTALEHDFVKAAAKVTELAKLAIAKTALDIEADAKVLAPVDTGNLKNSISSEASGLTAEVSASTAYSDYVEYGTSRMNAQPYMGPAFDARVPGLEKALGQIGEKIL